MNKNKCKTDVEEQCVISFFLSCANPFSTVVLDRINRALKNSDTSEAKTKEGKKTDDKGELKDRYITSIGKQMDTKTAWLTGRQMQRELAC